MTHPTSPAGYLTTLPPGSPRVAIDAADPRLAAFRQNAFANGLSQREFSDALAVEAKRGGAIPGWDRLSFAQQMSSVANRR